MAKKAPEVPGNDSSDEQVNEALNNVDVVEKQAKSLDEKISQLQDKLLTAESDDDKSVIQLQLDALLETKEQIDAMLVNAKEALQSVQAKATMAASAQKKTDMTDITIGKGDTRIISGPNITLTKDGYFVTSKKGDKAL